MRLSATTVAADGELGRFLGGFAGRRGFLV
jgi:hypothetical protein